MVINTDEEVASRMVLVYQYVDYIHPQEPFLCRVYIYFMYDLIIKWQNCIVNVTFIENWSKRSGFVDLYQFHFAIKAKNVFIAILTNIF